MITGGTIRAAGLDGTVLLVFFFNFNNLLCVYYDGHFFDRDLFAFVSKHLESD